MRARRRASGAGQGILGVLLVATSAGLLWGCVGAFAGAAEGSRSSSRSRVAREARATGRSRRCPDNLPGGSELWIKDAEDGPRPFYGWSQELGKWVEWPRDGLKKWWQQPGYLTPNGYRQNPVWNINDYNLCTLELTFAFMEAKLTEKLKASGMTIEQIRAKAQVYEFLESQDRPKVTDKMMFLLQVKALHDGRSDELIDLREGPDKFLASAAPLREDGSEPMWKDIWEPGDPFMKPYTRDFFEKKTGKKLPPRKTPVDEWNRRFGDDY